MTWRPSACRAASRRRVVTTTCPERGDACHAQARLAALRSRLDQPFTHSPNRSPSSSTAAWLEPSSTAGCGTQHHRRRDRLCCAPGSRRRTPAQRSRRPGLAFQFPTALLGPCDGARCRRGAPRSQPHGQRASTAVGEIGSCPNNGESGDSPVGRASVPAEDGRVPLLGTPARPSLCSVGVPAEVADGRTDLGVWWRSD
jgi:hypothetical protein